MEIFFISFYSMASIEREMHQQKIKNFLDCLPRIAYDLDAERYQYTITFLEEIGPVRQNLTLRILTDFCLLWGYWHCLEN